ncbi:MAG TPA: hypothetical protein VFV50_14735 [Bdellovibrionales bacterium]|nr:hypothetical protein [Bdellovibrionales bacterium]
MIMRDGFRHLSLLLGLLAVVAACSQAEFSKAPAPDTGATAGNPTPTPDPNPVCDPFGGGPVTAQNGLSGDIYYLNDSQPLYENINAYFTYGTKIADKLFLSELNTPTRWFDQGFYRQDGTYLTRADGTMLMEKFALKLESTIKLAAGDAVGFRQFAVLSDDGSVFTVRHNNQTKQLVAMNRVQNTTLGCAGENIYFDQNTSLPMKMDYFQGPRYHIALILLWRTAPSASPQGEPLCGQGSNEMYFDYRNNSYPQQAYVDLWNRGWRPVRPQNFFLNGPNPCAQ